MGLQEKLSRLRKGFESQAPKEVVDVMHRATDNLEKSGILDGTVKVGDQAPDFSLKNADGQEFSLNGSPGPGRDRGCTGTHRCIAMGDFVPGAPAPCQESG